jgi:hypothetical protein
VRAVVWGHSTMELQLTASGDWHTVTLQSA